MGFNQGLFGVPGQSTLLQTADAEILWGGDESRITVLRKSSVISSAATDAGNTPTSILRKGLLMGQITSSGKLVAWNSANTDGSENIAGILGVELIMVDGNATAVDRCAPLVIKAPVKASALLIQGAAFVGHADEFVARRRLSAAGYVLDDDPLLYLAGLNPRFVNTVADYTVLTSDNGKVFVATTANVNFTLPSPQLGLVYEFVRGSDHNLVITATGKLIEGNTLSGNSTTFSTAGNKIGARVRVTGVNIPGTGLRWLPEVLAVPFSTGTLLTQTNA